MNKGMENPQTFDNETFFFGEYEHSLDSQGRIAIPRDWRQEEGETRLILLPGRDNDLLLFPFATFREFLQKAGKLSLANRELQAALAKIGARARDCRCDKQGRIKLDKNMLAAIGVTNQLKMIGALTHIKLCSLENWQSSENLGDDAYLDEFQKISESVNGFSFGGGV
ncbi:MAG: cell division/cell wall cluster transcriptional repressor MraZ [Lentisphaeria bacterium]|nr:cell division/cell wall cluster transcriptional repressor MraZ [Lentisphaeria bacterium]